MARSASMQPIEKRTLGAAAIGRISARARGTAVAIGESVGALPTSPKGQPVHWIDPDHLLETPGVLTRFLLGPHGEIEGFLLDDVLEVHLPPHLGPRLREIAEVGDPVKVRGVRPRGVTMLAAVSVENEEGDEVVDEKPTPAEDAALDHGRHEARAARRPMEHRGVIVRPLHGPKGELRGALLDDGTTLRWPPHHAPAVGPIEPGRVLAVRGDGLASPLGTVIDVKAVGPALDALAPFPPPDGPPKHGPPKHGPPMHEPPKPRPHP